jgi:N-methylhydantoinase A
MPGRMIGVDVGGTFTDVVAVEGGRVTVAKVPTSPEQTELSVLAGAKEVGVAAASTFNLASTAGLNAVITRNLPKVAVLVTMGHRDTLDGGRLVRPFEAITNASWRRRFGDAVEPLVPRYLRRPIAERTLASGDVLIPLDESQAREQLQILARSGVEGVAICLMNGYVNGDHEQRLKELVQEELGDLSCSVSSEVSPMASEYSRASTTVVDVFMKLLYSGYTGRLQQGLEDQGFSGTFNYADCRAMLMSAKYAMERPFQLVFGGPAAGSVACAHFGRHIGDSNLLCADIGGTSCDISIIEDGRPWSNTELELEFDLVVNAESIEIITLGAGGGSVVSVTPAGEIAVGPDSAGASPGPAAYGQGGESPTLTDAAVLIGILDPGRFLGGSKPLYVDAAKAAFDSLDTQLPRSERVRSAWGIGLNNVAQGILNLVIRRGVDPRDFTLVAYGAAGPMLLPGLLDLVPLRRVIVPPNPGLFSAVGLVSADQVYSDQRSRYLVLGPSSAPELEELFSTLERNLLSRLGADAGQARVARTLDARLVGQMAETPYLDLPDGEITGDVVRGVIAQFHDRYERLNHNRFEAIPVQAVNYRVTATIESDKVTFDQMSNGLGQPQARDIVLRHLAAEPTQATEYERDELPTGHTLTGPAVVREQMSTTFVPAGHELTVGAHGELVIV